MIYLCHMIRIVLLSTKNSWRNFGVKILGWPARATCLVSVPVIQLETGRTFCSRQLCVKIRDKKGVELLLWSEKIKSFFTWPNFKNRRFLEWKISLKKFYKRSLATWKLLITSDVATLVRDSGQHAMIN